MIKKVLCVLSFMIGMLHGKYEQDVADLLLQDRIGVVRDAITTRYEDMIQEIIYYHEVITDKIVSHEIDLQAYMSPDNHELQDMAHDFLLALRAFANQKVLEIIPDAGIEIVEEIHEYVEELYNLLCGYLFAFSPVGLTIEED